MEITIRRVSDRDYSETVDVNTIRDLFNLCEKHDEDIIIMRPRFWHGEYSLLIYDGYLE
jgi:hypothetical protein